MVGLVGVSSRIGKTEREIVLEHGAEFMVREALYCRRPDFRGHYRIRTGARFGVSKTHGQKILQDAARAELVLIGGRGGRLVTLSPRLWRACDRFLADSMSGHEMLFDLARRQVARGEAQSRLLRSR